MGCLRLRWIGAVGIGLGLAMLGGPMRPAAADPIHTITNLGPLPGTTQSIATGINASGQVTGVSYTTSDGTWGADLSGIRLSAPRPDDRRIARQVLPRAIRRGPDFAQGPASTGGSTGVRQSRAWTWFNQ